MHCNESPIAPGILQPTKTNWLQAPAPYYYNEELRNSAVINRYLGYIPNSISAYFGTASNLFKAIKTNDFQLASDPLHPNYLPPGGLDIRPFVFENDTVLPGFDDGNNFSTALYEYTCPFGGIYSFDTGIIYDIAGLYNGINYFELTLGIIRYDNLGVAGGNILQTVASPTSIHFSNAAGYVKNHTASFNCNAGDKIIVAAFVLLAGIFNQPVYQYITFKPNSFFQCTQAVIGNEGVFEFSDPADYKIIQLEFEYPLNAQQFKILKNNSTGLYKVSQHGRSRYAWIDNIKYQHQSSLAKVQLVTSINVNQ